MGYFNFAARLPVLILTFVLTIIIVRFIFPMLPVYEYMFDLLPSYSYETALSNLEAMGEEGRQQYALFSGIVDSILPLCFTTFYVGIIWRCAPIGFLKALVIVPLLGGLSDYAENIQVIGMLLQYPNISEAQVGYASMATFAKGQLLNAALIIASVMLVLGFIKWIWKKIFVKNNA